MTQKDTSEPVRIRTGLKRALERYVKQAKNRYGDRKFSSLTKAADAAVEKFLEDEGAIKEVAQRA
jgi:hypothetical protein